MFTNSGAQAQVLVNLAQQQHPAVAAEVPAAEIGLDDAATEAPEIDPGIRTPWHRPSSVGIGAPIPMTTRHGTRLPT
jgi:hypothetical protein